MTELTVKFIEGRYCGEAWFEMHTRIKLESPEGNEMRIDAGETSFPDKPWRIRITNGSVDEEQFATQDELYVYVDSYVKERLAKGWKITKYKQDDLDIDYLAGLDVT